MDLRPRTPSPPARPAHRAAPGAVQKKPASGKAVPVLPGSTTVLNGGSAAKDKLPAGRGKAAAAVSGVHQTQRVECWVYGEGGAGGAAPESSSKSGTIAQSDIARFLREPPRKSLAGNKAPVAGLQLVCHRQHISMERPFDESSFRAINAALGLLPRHEYLTALNAGACGKYIAAAGNLVFIYRRSSNNGTISAVINYNSDSNITRGYILMGPRIPIKKVCDEILSQFPYFSHPLLIPTLLVELTAADLMSELYHIHHSLASVENKTRFGDWELSDTTAECPDGEEREEEGADGTNEKWDGAASESENDDNEDNNGEAPGHNWLGGKVREVGMDLGSPYWAAMERAMRECSSKHEMARLLGTLSCRFAFMKVAVGCSVSMAEFTLREMDHMKTYAVTPARFRQLAKITNGECLRHRVELLLSNLQHMNTFAAIDQRMQAQQNIIFNLITQNDSNLNMEIAKDSKELAEASKRDSAAMKIIAVLTTIFLPATFLATFFAMPLFDWSAINMSDVGTSHLWIYWAVAIPTTAMLMVAVGGFAVIQSRKNREAARNAREKAGAGRV